MSKLFRRMIRNIVSGVLILLPSVTTIYVFAKLFGLADSMLPSFVHSVVPKIPSQWIPGVGLLLIVVIAYFTGAAAKNYLGKKIIQIGNKAISGIPLVNKVYLGVQQILDAVAGKKKLFEQVVLVDFPGLGGKGLGFLTSRPTGELAMKSGGNTVTVFVPTSPTPTQGFILIVPETSVTPLSMSAETALKLLVSAGALSPEQLKKTQHLYTVPTSSEGWNWLKFGRRGQPGHRHDPRD